MISERVADAERHYSTGLQKEMEARYLHAGQNARDLSCDPNCLWLDIGPSIGIGLQKLKESQPDLDIITVDIQSDYLQATLRNNIGIQAAVMNGCQLGFRSCSLSAVSLFEVIEHMAQSQQSDLLSEVNRVLKPGGLLFLSTPNREAHGTRSISSDHVHELNQPELLTLVNSSNFDLIHLKGQGFKTDNPRIKLWEKARDNPILFWTYHHLLPNHIRHDLRDQTLQAFETETIREPMSNELIKSFYVVGKKSS